MWRVICDCDQYESIYHSTNGLPVTEEHVKNSPNVKKWAEGSTVTVKPYVESRKLEDESKNEEN